MSVDTTYEETIDLQEPYYTGPGVVPAEEAALPVAIDGRGFGLDISDAVNFYHRYQRAPVNLTNTQQANSGGDQAQTSPEVWRRSIETWDSGAGQTRVDRDNSIPGRFNDSYRVNVWDPWRASLLNDTKILTNIGGNPAFLATLDNARLVCVTGTDLFWWDAGDLDSDPVGVTGVGSAVAVTTDGVNLYVLDDSGNVELWQAPGSHHSYCVIPSVYAGPGVPSWDSARPLLAYCQGYLVSAVGNDLIDITNALAPTRIYLHPLTSWTWRAATDGLNGTYLIGGAGDRWNVLAMQLKSDATTFDPPAISAPLPKGEVARSLGSYLGYLLIGSDAGWRFATTDSSLKATYGRLVTSTTPVRCFEGQDRFVWYGADGLSARTAGLGRADLETFVGTLTPASASDLVSDSVVGEVDAVITFDGRRVFTVRGVGVYAESTDLAPDGWLTQGQASFNSSDTKTGLYAEVFTDPLVGSVYVDAAYDDGDWHQLGLASVGDSVSTGHLNIEATFKHLELRYRLIRSTTHHDQGPSLTRSEARAIDIAGKASEWRLPLRIARTEEYDGVPMERTIRDRYDLLIELAQTRRMTTMRLYGRSYQVYMADYLDLGERPTEDDQDLEGTFIAVMREVV